MNKIIYSMLLFFAITSCREEIIEPKIESLPNYYQITNDNPNDPVEHKRYELYKEYGVAVFLQDTVAKIFVKIAQNGDSIFNYERVDMNWGFSSNSTQTSRYEHTYYETEAEKLGALFVAESYLKEASAPLRPFCILLTKKTAKVEIKTAVKTQKSYEIGYRALLMCETTGPIPTYVGELKKQMVSKKLANYDKELGEFSVVSDKKYYNVNLTDPITKNGLAIVWDSSKVMLYDYNVTKPVAEKIELNAMRLSFKFYERNYPHEPLETFEECRQSVRRKLGVFGFIRSSGDWETSYKASDELDYFLIEILGTDRIEFERRWGDSPLVMKKYEILYAIIKEKLGVEL